MVAEQILKQLEASAGDDGREERKDLIQPRPGRAGCSSLSSMDHEDDDPGTTWNERARDREPDRMSPRMAWRAIQAALPKEAIISSDIGNNCAIGNAYPTFEEGRKYLAPGPVRPVRLRLPGHPRRQDRLPRHVPVVGFAGDGAFGISMNEMTACGRDDWPPITMVIFRNYQWGAEKRNTTLVVQRQFRRHRARPRRRVCQDRCRPAASRASRSPPWTRLHRRPERTAVEDQMKNKRNHFHRVRAQPGAGRAVPPRCHEDPRSRSPALTRPTCVRSRSADQQSNPRGRAGPRPRTEYSTLTGKTV